MLIRTNKKKNYRKLVTMIEVYDREKYFYKKVNFSFRKAWTKYNFLFRQFNFFFHKDIWKIAQARNLDQENHQFFRIPSLTCIFTQASSISEKSQVFFSNVAQFFHLFLIYDTLIAEINYDWAFKIISFMKIQNYLH